MSADLKVLPTGTVTFLFTDIEGSTPMWDAHPTAMDAALSRHDEILHESISGHDGYVFSPMGDGMAAVFSRAADAVAAAVEAQVSLAAEEWPGLLDLRVRMGIHTGEAQERDGNYFGPPVNRAGRIMGASHGGQLVISALTARLLDHSGEVKLIDLGAVALKGVVDPVHVFGVAASGLDWIERPLTSTQETAGNLPRLRTDSVGDLADMHRRVSRLARTRLVTLTGSGGVGKTRAALEVGWLVVDEFVDGVWMVELGPIADPETVVAAVASTLGIRLQPDMTMVESVVDWCLGRRMLLLLDNCEHVLDPIAELVGAVISDCPTVTILATSREPLGVAGEQVIRIPSLDANQSVELFCNRAVAADSSFSPTPDDIEAIAAVCTRVDGIPLAIELAAARTRSLSPVDLLTRLDDRFRVLRGAGRGGMERHQTLRAAVTWSYQLLSDLEQILFDRLSVFAGTFNLRAAEVICSGDELDEYDIVDLISQLVDKSMVIAERSGSGTRYRLLETLRQYGEDRLDDRGETARLRDEHRAHYCGVIDNAFGRWLGPDQAYIDETVGNEWDNLRAAHSWAIASRDLEAAESIIMDTQYNAMGQLRLEHEEWAERTLALGLESGSVAASTYGCVAFWAFLNALPAKSIELSRRAIDENARDPKIGTCHAALVYGLMAAGRTDEARAALPDLVELLATSPDPGAIYAMRMVLADASAAGLTDEDHLTPFVDYCRDIGSPAALARAAMIRSTSLASADSPDLVRALASSREAIRQGKIGAPFEIVWGLAGVAYVHVIGGLPDSERALREAISHSYDSRLWLAVDLVLENFVVHMLRVDPQAGATILGHLEPNQPANFGRLDQHRGESLATVAAIPEGAEWMETGRRMDRHEIVAYALDHLGEG